MHLANLTDSAALDQFDRAVVSRRRMHLRSHLGGHIRPSRLLHDHAALVHVPRQRLFTIHVLLSSERRKDGECVRVLGCGDKHRINVIHLGVQLAKVLVGTGAGELGSRSLQAPRVHITQRDHLRNFRHLLQLAQMRTAPPADRDARDVHLGIWRSC